MDVKKYFKKSGLIPAIVTDAENGEVLMLAYMNEESLQKHWRPVTHGSGAAPVRNSGTRARPLVISRRWLRCTATATTILC